MNMNSSKPTFTSCATSGRTTAMPETIHATVSDTRNRHTSGIGRYSRCDPACDVGAIIASRTASEHSSGTKAARTCLTGTSSIGNTEFRRIARFDRTEFRLLVTDSLNPR